MPRSIVLGNGQSLVCIDDSAQVRDVYFHFVGQENHVSGHQHRLGVWIDGEFSWIRSDDDDWTLEFDYEKESLVSNISASNEKLGVTLHFRDCVYNEKDIFIREVEVTNLKKEDKEIRIFFRQEFQIAGSKSGNSVYFDPAHQSMIHYKGRRVFMINGSADGKGISKYTTSSSHAHGSEGSWQDAEDGELEGVPVKHGAVDSTIGFTLQVPAGTSKKMYYWFTMALGVLEAQELNEYVIKKTPRHLIKTTGNYWRAWVNKWEHDYGSLSPEAVRLFKQSLLIIRTHVDNRGAIIASADSDMLQDDRDAYSYMWPRDGAFVAIALDKAGFYETTHEFYEFCHDVIHPDGYLMHKFQCDRSLGSSWHTWVGRDGEPSLPIQEDETALVLVALWHHYEKNRDLEFVEKIYNSFIKKAGYFMVKYRDDVHGLPKPSYDLWETILGISSFTTGSVFAGLKAAAKFANLLGKIDQAEDFDKAAEEIKQVMLTHLWDEERGYFLKNVIMGKDGNKDVDTRIDASSFYGAFGFDVLPVDDERITRAAALMKKTLADPVASGGFARVEGDPYYKTDSEAPGNPWVICTMWYAEYIIKKATSMKELEEAEEYFEWVVKRANTAGVLSEQYDPDTGAPISVSPLTWSHATYVNTVLLYLEKRNEFVTPKVC